MKNNDALRKSILKYALEGRLSKRSEDNGSTFFNELIKAGNRIEEHSSIFKREDKYIEKVGKIETDITEEIPFDIPANWVWCRFEDICDFSIGKTPERKTSAYWNSNDIPWVSISDMKDNAHIDKTKEFISAKAKEDCFSFPPFKPGTMLMSFKLTIGRTSIVDMPCYCNEAIMQFEPFIYNEVFRNFLFTFIGFLSKEIRVTDAIKGSTLNKKKLSQMLIPLPPIVEQAEIIEKINRLNPLLNQHKYLDEQRNQLNIKLKKSLELSVLKYVMSGNAVNKSESEESSQDLYKRFRLPQEKMRKSEIKMIPPVFDETSNTIVCDLRDLAKVFGGKRVPKNMSWQDEPTAHRYIRVTDMKNQTVITESPKFINEEVFNVISKYTVKENDVYITVAGTIGEAGVIPKECDGANLTENANKIILPSFIIPMWFAYQLNSDYVQDQIADLKTQVAQPKLAIKRIESLRIRIIPKERQLKELEILGRLKKEISAINS